MAGTKSTGSARLRHLSKYLPHFPSHFTNIVIHKKITWQQDCDGMGRPRPTAATQGPSVRKERERGEEGEVAHVKAAPFLSLFLCGVIWKSKDSFYGRRPTRQTENPTRHIAEAGTAVEASRFISYFCPLSLNRILGMNKVPEAK